MLKRPIIKLPKSKSGDRIKRGLGIPKIDVLVYTRFCCFLSICRQQQLLNFCDVFLFTLHFPLGNLRRLQPMKAPWGNACTEPSLYPEAPRVVPFLFLTLPQFHLNSSLTYVSVYL